MMKLSKIVITGLMFLFTLSIVLALGPSTLPSVKIKDLKGETVDTKSFNNEGKPFLVCFWATWCKPCIQELSLYHELYEQWQKETGIKIYAISIDDTRSSKKVAPFINGRGWKYDILLDENSEFRRAMNVNNPPHTFLVNSKGEVVWQHVGFAEGDEEELYKEFKALCDKEKGSK